MLVIEGDHIAPGRERHQIVGRLVVTQHGVSDLRGALVRRSRQHPEPDAKSDRSRGCHPGQLASPDHPDDRWPACGGTLMSLLVIHYPP